MKPKAQTPTDILRQMAGGFSLTQILFTAVKLGIADQLSTTPKQAQELAKAVGVAPQPLYRFLRMMVVLELLVQGDDGGFRLSEVGELLRTDHPESMRNRILYIGEVNYPAAQGMLHAVQTGEPAFDHVFGKPLFAFLEQNPRVGGHFNKLMARENEDRVAGIVAGYDFARFDSIVDVGGGVGTLMTGILRSHSYLRGIIFDVPDVVVQAARYLTDNGVADRCQVVAGDFFRDAIPAGSKLYLMSNIIHDWDDDRAKQILLNCRAAMGGDATLLLIEEIMPKHVTEAPVSVSSDFSMLLLTGGRERTAMEFEELLAMVGLRLATVIPFEPSRIYSGRKPNFAIIECKPQ